MSVWEAGVDRAATSRPFVHLGYRLGDVRALRARGADIRAAVSVAPEGLVAPIGPSDVPLLSLTAPRQSTWALQSEGFGRTLEAAEDVVQAFLDEHDPDRGATVIGAFAVPSGATGGRPHWVADTALSRSLEAKAPTGAPLGDLLPWIEGEPGPERADDRWWRATIRRLDTDRLVLQRVGLSSAGEGTWICRTVDEVRAVLHRCPEVRVSPWREGVAANIMGAVTSAGDVLVFPPSLQLIASEVDGRAVYFGNVVGGDHVAGLDELATGARRSGAALAGMGYVGMFGLDAIVGAAGPEYHDLNARLNGVILAFNLDLPAMVGTLLLSGWCGGDQIGAAEAEVRASVDRRPVARWLLRRLVTRPGPTGPEPAAGLYRVDPEGPTFTLVEADATDGGAVGGDVVLVDPRREAADRRQPGDQVAIANLWCTPDLSDAIIATHGPDSLERMTAALGSLGGA